MLSADDADPVVYTQAELEEMTKTQLVELAKSLDIEVYSSWTKAVIIETILSRS